MLALGLLILPVVALVAALWTAIDAARRGQNWFGWGVAVAVTGAAVIAWLVVRRGHHTGSRPCPANFFLGLAFLIGLNLLLTRNVAVFLYQPAKVEGQAMSPTLQNRERVIVNKLAYRKRPPRRGEIVMLFYPLNPDRTLVQRVIAEEGDQVRIVDGRVFLNTVELDEDYVPPEFRSHDHYGPQVVPQGYYFVLGDRRNNSSDSRHWGFVPKKYIIGTVTYRWWPLARAGTLR